MRVLVTGGAGFIGSTVVDRLVAHGHEVFVVDDLSTGKLANLEDARRTAGEGPPMGRVHFHRFDIRSQGVRDVMAQARPDAVCHLAAQGSVPRSVADPILDAQINVVGLLNVLIGCVEHGVGKIVFSSSGGTIYGVQTQFPVDEEAVGRPAQPYGITKAAAEDYLRFFESEHGLRFTSLALANVYGPRQDPLGEAGVVAIFANKLVAGEAPTINGTGEFTRDFVYVDDVAHGFVLALDEGDGQTFNIGTGLEVSINTLFKMMAETSGYRGEANYGPARAGDLARNSLDPTKAEMGLGWRPWTSLADGLRETIDWFAHQREQSSAAPPGTDQGSP